MLLGQKIHLEGAELTTRVKNNQQEHRHGGNLFDDLHLWPLYTSECKGKVFVHLVIAYIKTAPKTEDIQLPPREWTSQEEQKAVTETRREITKKRYITTS